MARIRYIKPGFFTDEEIVELPYEARLLFIGLWTIADREGRLDDKPKQIKMMLFPADNIDLAVLLSKLHQSCLIQRYVVDNKPYIQIVNFTKHQYPHVNERESTIPAPELSDTNPPVLRENGEQIPDKQIPVQRKVSLTEKAREVFKHWQEVFGHSKAVLSTDRMRKITARLEEGFSVEDLKLAIDGCRASPFHMGKNDKDTVYDGIKVIFRDAEQVEKFIDIAKRGNGNGKYHSNTSVSSAHDTGITELADNVTFL